MTTDHSAEYREMAAAVRRGAAHGKQTRGQYFNFRFRSGKQLVDSCAVGAAMLGMARLSSVTVDEKHVVGRLEAGKFRSQYRIFETRHLCPGQMTRWQCFNGQSTECVGEPNLFTMITHLNDFHCWTREEIADWLDALGAEARPADPPRASTETAARKPVTRTVRRRVRELVEA